MALIRDLYEGRAMARVMSFIAAVFIIVPALAPIIGGFIFKIYNWRSIFLMLTFMGCVPSVVWTATERDSACVKSQ